MFRKLVHCGLGLLLSVSAVSANAAVIDFNSIANTEVINTQYSGSGVTFSGALIGLTNPGDTILFNGSTIASNWNYGLGDHVGTSWSAAFGTTQTSISFWSETNSGDNVTIEAFDSGVSVGSQDFINTNGLTVDLLTLSILSGFDSITVTTWGQDNGFFAMDDFTFTSGNGNGNGDGDLSPVPIPAAALLFGAALLGFAGWARREKVS